METKILKSVPVGEKITMIVMESSGKYSVKKVIATPKAKFFGEKTEYWYSVKDLARAEEYVVNEIKHHYLKVVEKETSRLAKIEYRKTIKAENPYKVGNILYTSWGYDQTNVDFYQITKVSGMKVTYRPIKSELVENEEFAPMSGRVKPVKDNFVGNERSAIITVTAYNGKASYHLKDGRQCLYATTENESHYCSWYA